MGGRAGIFDVDGREIALQKIGLFDHAARHRAQLYFS
jgi:hypothetical protein